MPAGSCLSTASVRSAASSAPEPSYGFPDLEEAGKAQSEVSELKREVFRLQQKLDAQARKDRG